MQKISFVIPCYRSAHTIKNVVDEIEEMMQAHLEYTYEVILVNDGSPDDVWQVIAEMCETRVNIRGINLSRNFGQHSALMAGYAACTGDFVVTLDDDGQTPAKETFTLLEKLSEGYDVVYGRYEERKDGLFRKLGTMMNNYMLEKIIGKPEGVHLTSFFVARKYIIEEILRYKNPYPYIWGLIARSTSNIGNATISHSERLEGKSGYTIKKLFGLWMNGFIGFSVKPLRIATCFGLLASIAGVCLAIYVIINKILHPDIVAGYSSLMVAMLIIGGVIMILLGMIGEYIGRIYISLNSSPQYVIKEIVGSVEEGQNDERCDN